MLRKIINILCILIVILMIIGSAVTVMEIWDAGRAQSQKPSYSGSEGFPYLLAIAAVPWYFLLILMILLELRHDILYFLAPAEPRSTRKTVFNIGGLILVALLGGSILLRFLIPRSIGVAIFILEHRWSVQAMTAWALCLFLPWRFVYRLLCLNYDTKHTSEKEAD